MPKYKIEAPDIELRCILCPKNPVFSDVSHLLTHIASKSHLACKFKLQVESRNQKHAKDKLEDFEFWYNTNNLDEMLGDRLAAKEDKKKKQKPGRGGAAIKRELKVGDDDYDNNLFKAPRANMHPFPGRSSVSHSTSAHHWDQSIYSTPTTRSKVPHFSMDESPDRTRVDPMLTTTPWKPDPEDDEEDGQPGEKITDSAKLKGIQWPGMAVFDAATPEGKRMRNQRKNSKVLRDMIATSEGVEPAEISYHANGEFRASRDIFGPLSTENSPVQPRRPSPKKRNVRKTRKPTFSDLSTNGPRLRATRGRPPKAVVAIGRGRERERERESHKDIAVSNSYRPNIFTQPPPTLNPLVGFTSSYNNHGYMASVDEEEEYRLTVGDFGKKKSAFSIFEDEISPAGTESPLEESHFNFSGHGLQNFQDNLTSSVPIPPSPTPATKQTSRNMGVMNGGNGGQAFGSMQGQENHFHTRRSLSDTTLFAPHTMHQNNFNPLSMFDNHGTHGYNRSYAYGIQPSYLFGGNQTSSYMENNMNSSSSGYGTNFMGDFRQINPMVNASLISSSNSNFQAGIASMADIGATGNNENALGLEFM